MAILSKGLVNVKGHRPDLREIHREARRLSDGEYAFYLCDKKPNKTLPRLKYLYAVVLKTISDELPDHPPVEVLYRKFEKMFAPIREARVFRSKFRYQDLKNCSARELEEVIFKIIIFSAENLDIELKERLNYRAYEESEPYIDAYNDQWQGYDRSI